MTLRSGEKGQENKQRFTKQYTENYALVGVAGTAPDKIVLDLSMRK